MSDILADYSEWLGGRPARVRTHYDRCHINHDACMVVRMAEEIARLHAELARPALTDAERTLIEKLTRPHPDPRMGRPLLVTPSERDIAAALLARLGGGQ